jgi:hypothetical protein
VNITETGGAWVAGFKKPPAQIDLVQPTESKPVLPGDIMFQRHANKSGHFETWKHIGLVTSVIRSSTDDFTTIEGNTFDRGRRINEYTHSMNERAIVGGKPFPKYGFLCVNTV